MQHILTHNNIWWLALAVSIQCNNPHLNVLNHVYLNWKKCHWIYKKINKLTHFMTKTGSREQHTVAKKWAKQFDTSK